MDKYANMIHLLHKRLQYEQLVNNIVSLALTADNNYQRFINRALELIGNVTGVSRAYIIERFSTSGDASIAYEWAAPEARTETNNSHDIKSSHIFWLDSGLQKNKVICHDDIEEISDEIIKRTFHKKKIKSILAIPIFVEQNYYGFLGLDECKYNRKWSEIDVILLQSISMIICQYMDKHYSNKKQEEEYSKYIAILNSVDNPIYVSDMEKYKIIYANEAANKNFNTELTGKICYKAIHNRNAPCEFCANTNFGDYKQEPYKLECYNNIVDKHVQLTSRVIRWPDGRDVCFGSMNDITKCKEIEQKLLFEKDRLKISEDNLKAKNNNLRESLESIILSLNTALGQKDSYSQAHQNQVSVLAVDIARQMNMPENRIEGLKLAALIHDVGKIGIPSEILNKPNKLTQAEYGLIKEHVQSGYEIVRLINFPWPVADILMQHHERMDGSGYPKGLRADEILPEAKILGVADTIDAMSSDRPYRRSFGVRYAIDEIMKSKGVYDEDVVSACIRVLVKRNIIIRKALESKKMANDNKHLNVIT